LNVSSTSHPPAAPIRPVFTLGSALRWLGHDCPDRRCTAHPIDALPVSMWFLRRGHPLPTYPLQTVLVVDLAETGVPLAHTHRLIDEVDRCTGLETIQIRRRYCSDTEHELVALGMKQKPPVSCLARDCEPNVGGFGIAVQNPGVVGPREVLERVSKDRTHRHLRCLPVH
jgi:hypothetical protein